MRTVSPLLIVPPRSPHGEWGFILASGRFTQESATKQTASGCAARMPGAAPVPSDRIDLSVAPGEAACVRSVRGTGALCFCDFKATRHYYADCDKVELIPGAAAIEQH